MSADGNPISAGGSIKVMSNLAPKWSRERQFQRFRVDLKLEVVRPDAKATVRGHVRDLSEGGVGAYVVADLAPGEEVTLEFGGAPLLRPIRVQAAVRDRTGYRFGFEFISLSREQRAIIHAAGLFLPSAA